MTETERIQEVCRYIDAHSDETLTVEALSQHAHMSKFHFARRFKALIGVTPQQYARDRRFRTLKSNLQAGKDVDAAIFDSGFGSHSRVYENASRRLGMTPAQYRRSGQGVAISYASIDTPVGLMLIGATDRGICFAQFGEFEAELLERLRREYRNAVVEPMRAPAHPDFARWVAAIERHLGGTQPNPDLPVDVRGTAFAMRVWRYLQSIPYGDVRSYAEVASGIGQPRAVRAVANACAANSVAVLIPCHRVIRQSGDLGGYRWGLERKRALLDRERAVKSA